jgi:hypothetical protein
VFILANNWFGIYFWAIFHNSSGHPARDHMGREIESGYGKVLKNVRISLSQKAKYVLVMNE